MKEGRVPDRPYEAPEDQMVRLLITGMMVREARASVSLDNDRKVMTRYEGDGHGVEDLRDEFEQVLPKIEGSLKYLARKSGEDS